MPKDFVLGISYADETVQSVVVKQGRNKSELYLLTESVNQRGVGPWFLNPISTIETSVIEKISRVSIAISDSAGFYLTFPVDTRLNRFDLKEQTNWELANFVDDFTPGGYSSQIRTLGNRPPTGVSEILAVTIKKTFLKEIRSALSERKLSFDLADTSFFGAQHALLSSHPDVASEKAALAGVARDVWTVGIIDKGKLVHFKRAIPETTGEAIRFTAEALTGAGVSKVFLYGVGLTPAILGALQSTLGVGMIRLNPFRLMEIKVPSELFAKFTGQEHRFAPSVGCALMKV